MKLSCLKVTLLLLLIAPLTVLAAGPGSHPYLFFSADEIPAMRQRVKSAPNASKTFNRILKGLPDEFTVKFPPLDGTIRDDWTSFVNRTTRVMRDAAFAWLMTGEQKYLDMSRDILLQCAENFDSRINFHRFADREYMRIYVTGQLGINAAWTYDMLYSQLSESERKLVEDEFLRGIVEMVRLSGTQTPSKGNAMLVKDYEWGPGQWNGVMYCNAGIASIGFALDDEEIYEHAVDNYRTYIARDILSDGLFQEEDWHYAMFCVTALTVVAEAAHNSGYHEDLYNMEFVSKPADQWDSNYGLAFAPEGEDRPTRKLKDFYDAILDCQYPDLSRNNLGWQMNSASFTGSGYVPLYELAWRRFNDNHYGWVLGKMDRTARNSYCWGLIGPVIFGDKAVGPVTPPDTASRVFNHGRWLVLKSQEGPKYWDSDAMFAFMPYGPYRTKALARLSLDLFAFGRVLAPRVTKSSRHQSHDHPWYLHDESWNNMLVDGENISIYRTKISDSRMRFFDFNDDFKAAQAVIEVQREIRPSIWSDENYERNESLDYRMGRALLMTDDYLVDVMHVKYLHPQEYLHSFTWNLHGTGKLTLEGAGHDSRPKKPFNAVWRHEDGVGLSTTLLPAILPDSHKVLQKSTPKSEYIQAVRFAKEAAFAAVHVPFKDKSKVVDVHKIWPGDLVQAIYVGTDDYEDIICLSCEDDTIAGRSEFFDADVQGPYAWFRFTDKILTVRGPVSYFRSSGGGDSVEAVFVNGEKVDFRINGEEIICGEKTQP